MIRKVHIQNFKSLADFEMELGRVNVIIGANGSGKTNILEGIAMGAAAAAGKLENEFLGARIRVTEPEYMRSGFESNTRGEVEVAIEVDQPFEFFRFVLVSQEPNGNRWAEKDWDSPRTMRLLNQLQLAQIVFLPESQSDKLRRTKYLKVLGLGKQNGESDIAYQARIQEWIEVEKKIQNQFDTIKGFLIYSPENTFLRKFEEPSQIYPLGIRGEGLFHELKSIFTDKKKKKQQAEIVEHLQLLDWFEDISMPNGLMSMEYKIALKDRFLDPKLAAFDQRSANEGFLMLLFYLVLFTSENTPKFFAIENIDTAFNPKMCREIMRLIAELAVKHEKQVFVTTHNPWTLDGLNLTDDEQRLFVARRNKLGHTKVERITQKADSNLMLSEIWTRGYFGGLPDNF